MIRIAGRPDSANAGDDEPFDSSNRELTGSDTCLSFRMSLQNMKRWQNARCKAINPEVNRTPRLFAFILLIACVLTLLGTPIVGSQNQTTVSSNITTTSEGSVTLISTVTSPATVTRTNTTRTIFNITRTMHQTHCFKMDWITMYNGTAGIIYFGSLSSSNPVVVVGGQECHVLRLQRTRSGARTVRVPSSQQDSSQTGKCSPDSGGRDQSSRGCDQHRLFHIIPAIHDDSDFAYLNCHAGPCCGQSEHHRCRNSRLGGIRRNGRVFHDEETKAMTPRFGVCRSVGILLLDIMVR